VDLMTVQVKPSLVNKLGILVATKLILWASRLTVTVRSYVAYLMRRYSYGRALYIPHGASVFRCLSLDLPERIVLMFGHMGPSKGLSTLLKAFEELVTEKNDVKLVIAGASHPNFPGYLESYGKIFIPKVDFLGYVHEEDLAKVFGIADVVVLPYLTATGTSGVFHLACSYGKPVVASDLPEIREMVAEGAAALLVPPSDVSALKKAILNVLGDEGLAARMREQNLAFAREESWSVVAKMFEQVYVELSNA
jgi:glycosyltransferase involved in cell wall biosynthesis